MKNKKTCPRCEGMGEVDSGGMTPWDAGINVCCPDCEGTGLYLVYEINQRTQEEWRRAVEGEWTVTAGV